MTRNKEIFKKLNNSLETSEKEILLCNNKVEELMRRITTLENRISENK